jgi:hypothetical protein
VGLLETANGGKYADAVDKFQDAAKKALAQGDQQT